MTEQTRASWVPREERGRTPTPTEIPPHPDEGGRPPCEAGSRRLSTDRPCPRPAVWHYGYIYYCPEHMEAARAGLAEDEAATAVYHAKRFLWKAQIEGLEHLARYLGDALVELENDLKQAEEAAGEAARKAGDRVS